MNSAHSARTVIAALVRAGISTFVLCPGSRSAPFAYALYEAERAGVIVLHVETDERVAGFVALGSGLAGRPAAVVTTSGTAVANLHPALEEAHRAGVALVAVTADRPHGMRGVGASQTTDQMAVLAGSVRAQFDLPTDMKTQQLRGIVLRAVRIATGEALEAAGPGPVQLNVGFEPPLVSEESWGTVAQDCAIEVPEAGEARTVVVAAPSHLAVDPADLAGVPVLAEPSSPLWGSASAIACHPILLRSELAKHIERVVVIGHPTLTRDVSALLARTDIDVVVADDVPIYTDVAGTARVVSLEKALALATWDARWLGQWQALARKAVAAIEEQAGEGLTFANVARSLDPAVPTLLGASSIIREVNLFAQVGRGHAFLANRGLAGIDGTMSTAIGMALVRGSMRVVVGDLTFIHDLGSLVHTAGQEGVNLDVVVIDDHGGSIFATLEHGGAPEPLYSRVFATAKEIDVEAYSRAVGAAFVRVGSLAELREALAAQAKGVRIVYVDLESHTAAQLKSGRGELQRVVENAISPQS
ncbi:2-succinyl-5-enolpyruvyl-6-hydroxy-3-cyclohexene-1-carboxylic-acid synthase [Arcanobacterium wilhelmae]|uniref:2-succinyl-5-enolpyruvyl-6-hydroxy-3- cyclohexene-1-carboxylic-acid synthase n=1 Tax=Arcanobacterium wilhelmae TaxID=1803177 RepID=UPI00241545BC|nr:2-succinyl-5-enolpyruvyl-6-hydroxy-3-cyclohexene-1-carboxylic-acid synthase [Arcanobacterium wilhelmae]WFN89977.1 2-succinyl-5-enolpyruvyl-6-hydroxy-3-cyclohexene-1-carboxylic-acid synthase [Arcanobacterium wilhelmae]